MAKPNYQAGKDSVAGFKSMFKGEIVEEDFVPLTQLDFQADLARIAAAKPDVLFASALMPGWAIALVKQFHQSGLAGKLLFLSAFTVAESTLLAEQDAALGLYGRGMTWAPNLDNAANKSFVDGYLAAYHTVPGSAAMQGYDAAQAIDAALTKTGGSTADKTKLRAAMRAGRRFSASPRGKFSFRIPTVIRLQDFYSVQKAAKRSDGLYEHGDRAESVHRLRRQLCQGVSVALSLRHVGRIAAGPGAERAGQLRRAADSDRCRIDLGSTACSIW